MSEAELAEAKVLAAGWEVVGRLELRIGSVGRSWAGGRVPKDSWAPPVGVSVV